MATKAKKKPAKKTAVTALAKPGATKIKANKTPANVVTKKAKVKQPVAGPWVKGKYPYGLWSRKIAKDSYVCVKPNKTFYRNITYHFVIDGNFGYVAGYLTSVAKAKLCADAVLVALGYKLTCGIPKGVK